MPTVYREGPFRFVIWPNDHRPPHVHAYNSDGRCVVEIESGHVRETGTVRSPDIVDAVRIVGRNQQLLLIAWRKIHGL